MPSQNHIHFTPLTPGQRRVAASYRHNDITFILGEAGGGKTFCALALALEEVLGETKRKKLFLARPLVPCGEQLGYLKGSLQDKLGPWHGALGDVLSCMSFLRVEELLSQGVVELTPLGLMRGRTVSRSVAVLTEAQNCTLAQLRMLLSRIGEHGKLVIEGDPTQSDIPGSVPPLVRVARALQGMQGVGVVRLRGGECVRHPLIPEMMKRLKGLEEDFTTETPSTPRKKRGRRDNGGEQECTNRPGAAGLPGDSLRGPEVVRPD